MHSHDSRPRSIRVSSENHSFRNPLVVLPTVLLTASRYPMYECVIAARLDSSSRSASLISRVSQTHRSVSATPDRKAAIIFIARLTQGLRAQGVNVDRSRGFPIASQHFMITSEKIGPLSFPGSPSSYATMATFKPRACAYFTRVAASGLSGGLLKTCEILPALRSRRSANSRRSRSDSSKRCCNCVKKSIERW